MNCTLTNSNKDTCVTDRGRETEQERANENECAESENEWRKDRENKN